MIKTPFCHSTLLLLLLGAASVCPAQERYKLQPGDILEVTVWKEPELSREVLIAPDGHVTLPLAGSVSARGKDATELEAELKTGLKKYIEEPEVTVALKTVSGSRVFVIGKVNRPGMYLLDGTMDVMQALSLAGGMTTFADVDNITILRRQGERQVASRFRYNEVSKGNDLEQNVLLESGDTVVVP